jgi:hypothetical protein
VTDLFHLQEDLDESQFELMFEKEFPQTIALQATIAFSSKIV